MILNLENLKAGIYWYKHMGRGWGGDIGNAEYATIYNSRTGGITPVGGRPPTAALGLESDSPEGQGA
jgi:hypothetical protein